MSNRANEITERAIKLIALGYGDNEIARMLQVDPRTIRETRHVCSQEIAVMKRKLDQVFGEQ